MQRVLYLFQRIRSDPVMHERVLKSYELMLDFYGMKLKDKNTGLCSFLSTSLSPLSLIILLSFSISCNEFVHSCIR